VEKPKVILTRIIHREIEVVKISFERNEEIMRCLRPLKDLRWSQTQRGWYVPFSDKTIQEIIALLGEKSIVDAGAISIKIDGSTAKSLGDNNQMCAANNITKPMLPLQKKLRAPPVTLLGVLKPEQGEKINEFRNWLRSRRYSENTIQT